MCWLMSVDKDRYLHIGYVWVQNELYLHINVWIKLVSMWIKVLQFFVMVDDMSNDMDNDVDYICDVSSYMACYPQRAGETCHNICVGKHTFMCRYWFLYVQIKNIVNTNITINIIMKIQQMDELS